MIFVATWFEIPRSWNQGSRALLFEYFCSRLVMWWVCLKIHNQVQICLDWSDLLCFPKVGLHNFIKRLEMNSYDRDRAERQRKHQPCQASQLLCLIPACVSSFQKVKKGFATCAPPFTNTNHLLKTAAYTSRFFFFMSLAEWSRNCSFQSLDLKELHHDLPNGKS